MSAITRTRGWRFILLLPAVLVAACAEPPVILSPGPPGPPIPIQTPTAPPIPPGMARFWFYRVFFPEDTGGMPAVAMNGRTVGYALAGANFYRDVPPGEYLLTVETDVIDYHQSQVVAAAPGQEIFVKIGSLPDLDTGGFWTSYRRAAYYVMLPAPRWPALELPLTRATDGYSSAGR